MYKRRRQRIRRKPSPMPVWIVEATNTKGVIKLTCPRQRGEEACGKPTWVRRRDWLSASTFQTRSCTHCFRASQIPEGMIK